MKNSIRYLCGFFIVLFFSHLFPTTAALAQNKKIFILHSYHQEYPWTKNENKGFTQTLTNRFLSGNINFSTEYLDTKRVEFNKEYQEFFCQYLKQKYVHYSPDVIFCSDDNALSFLLQFKENLFGRIPVVFCGVNNIDIQKDLKRQEYTGVFEKKEIIPNLVLLKQIISQPGSILFFGDNTSTHHSIVQTIKDDIASQFPEQKYAILAADKLPYLIKQLKKYGEGIIFLTTIGGIKDGDDVIIPLKNILNAIVNAGDFTIISMEDVYLEQGILGGYVTSGYSQGEKAAHLTTQILQGRSPASIPMVTESPNQYMFNYPELKKFGITISQLPEKSIVLNEPQSFYDLYKYRIWSAILFLIFQTIVIIALIQNIGKRKKAETSLQNAHSELEKKVLARTEQLTETNINLNNEIKERKRAEEILESQNQLMKTLLDNLRVGVFMIEAPSGKPLLTNQRAKDLLGRGIMNDANRSTLTEVYQAFKGETNELYPENELPIVRGLMGEKHSVDDMVVVQPSGRRVHLEVFGSPVKDKKGNIVASLVSFSDITDRKQVEESIRGSEKRFRDLAEMLPEAVFETDAKMTLTYVNQQAFSLFGYTQEDFEKGLNALVMISFEDRNRAQENIVKRMQGEELGTTDYNALRKDGSTFPVFLHVNPIIDRGTVKGFRGIIIDLTDYKRMETQLQQAQKIESIGNLAGGIAHDFNNILFPIVGMSEMLIEDLPAESSEHESAIQIFKAAIRGRDLVKQILAFSRQSEHKFIPTRIQNVIKEVIKLSRSTIPSSIEIGQDIQQDCGMVMADPAQIHQIGMNIITNAYHAVETTGGKISVMLRQTVLEAPETLDLSLSPGTYAVLSTSDTGHGISAELMNKIFDPYFTTKEQGKGTGLGLAVVYGIVKEHGGDIKVESEIGKGTIFTVYLPLIKETHETPTIEKADTLPTGQERILLVDDEEAIVYLEKQMLERLGYQISFRTSSVDALEAFKANPDAFDVVITDMTMPNMTGDQLAKELISIKPDIPIILCTGFSERIDREKSEAIGIKGFLMKPVVMSEIAEMVRKVLDETKVSY